MTSFYIIQSGESAKIETTFVPSLELEGSFEIALHSLETYYSFPNVDEKNNKIRVSLDSGTSWSNLAFAVGCYEHKDINAELQRQLVVLGGKKDDITLKPNKNTFQTIMTIAGNVQVDFTVKDSIRTVLGFNSKIYTSG